MSFEGSRSDSTFSFFFFFFKGTGAPRNLPPSPPRRSSDLPGQAPADGEPEEEMAPPRAVAGGGGQGGERAAQPRRQLDSGIVVRGVLRRGSVEGEDEARSEEHTSELQSPCNLVCRLLLEKK